MSETNTSNTAFWIVGILFLIWNIIGCSLYLMDVTMNDAAYLDMYGEAMAAVRPNIPVWTMAAYAIAVWSGLLASIMFLLRRGLAVPVFTVSLIAAIISFAWSFLNADARAAGGSTFFVMPLIVVGLGAFEVWWSRRQKVAGILR